MTTDNQAQSIKTLFGVATGALELKNGVRSNVANMMALMPGIFPDHDEIVEVCRRLTEDEAGSLGRAAREFAKSIVDTPHLLPLDPRVSDELKMRMTPKKH